MPTIIWTLPASKLQSYKRGPATTVRFRSRSDSESIILAESFPKDLGVAFSSLFQKAFPPLNKCTIVDISKPKANHVTIEGGDPATHKEVIKWMISCCDGKGYRVFPTIAEKPYWGYAKLFVSAQKFEIDNLAKDIWERLGRIAVRQVHSDDITEIYSAGLAPDNVFRMRAVKSIGDALLEKRLVAYLAYAPLKTKFPEFDQDLNKYIGAIRQTQDAVKMAERAVEQKDRWAKHIANTHKVQQKVKKEREQQKEKARKSQDHLQEGINSSKLRYTQEAEAVKTCIDQNGTVHVTIMAPVVRKSAKGRPTYVKAPNALLDARNMYRPAAMQSHRPKSVSRSSSHRSHKTQKPNSTISSFNPSTPTSLTSSSEYVATTGNLAQEVKEKGDMEVEAAVIESSNEGDQNSVTKDAAVKEGKGSGKTA